MITTIPAYNLYLIFFFSQSDELMRNSGILITNWPWTPCCDVAGVVVEIGSEVTRFKVGDKVFGCQGVGFPGSGGAAEYCLFSEDIAFKKPDHISLAEAATMGVGNQVRIPRPDKFLYS